MHYLPFLTEDSQANGIFKQNLSWKTPGQIDRQKDRQMGLILDQTGERFLHVACMTKYSRSCCFLFLVIYSLTPFLFTVDCRLTPWWWSQLSHAVWGLVGRQSHRIQGKIQTFSTLLNFGHTSATCPMYIVCYLLFIFVVLLIIVLIIVVYSAYSFYCIIYILWICSM